MNERLIRPNGAFEAVQAALQRVVAEVAQIGQQRLPLAAE